MDYFLPIPKELNFIRKFPVYGGWGMLIPVSAGLYKRSIPNFCKELDINPFDIFYVSNERIKKQPLEKIKKDLGLYEEMEDDKFIKYRVFDILEDFSNCIQHTILDAHLGKSKLIRFFSGELNVITEDKLKNLIEFYNIKPLNIIQKRLEDNPLLEDTIKDLIGALQIDGLSKNEAIQTVVEWNELDVNTGKKIIDMPNHYYSLKKENLEIMKQYF